MIAKCFIELYNFRKYYSSTEHNAPYQYIYFKFNEEASIPKESDINNHFLGLIPVNLSKSMDLPYECVCLVCGSPATSSLQR